MRSGSDSGEMVVAGGGERGECLRKEQTFEERHKCDGYRIGKASAGDLG